MSGSSALVAGIDSSTQSCKIDVRRLDTGDVVAAASAKHPPTNPPVSEQDPAAWWDALCRAMADIDADVRSNIIALSVGGQQHGLVLLDADDRPVRLAKLWNDTTSAPQAQQLVDGRGGQWWSELTGTVPVGSITISKLMWVAQHEADLLDRVTKVMLPHDYLTFRLAGRHSTDRGDASGTSWFDPVSNEYTPAAFKAAGLDPAVWIDRLPTVIGPNAVVGPVTAAANEHLGLTGEVLVGPGSGDNMAAAVGIGLEPGDVTISLGTSGVAYAVSETPTRDPSGAVAGFASACGRFLPLVCTLNATKVTDTVARWLGADAQGLGQLALAADDDPGEVIAIPYFDGERTPNLPDALGALHGLSTSTTRQQIALAAHDGVLCGLLDGVDALRAAGARVDGRIYLVGGGARSPAYRRRLADLSGQDVTVPTVDEAVATGAAVQAAAIATSQTVNDVINRWNLSGGLVTSPVNDASQRRVAYKAKVSQMTSL